MGVLGLILSGVLLGSMLLFVAIVAPTVFKVLEPEPAGGFLRALFPRLYVWITAVAAVTSVVLLFSTVLGALLMFGVAVGAAYSNWILTPQINAARDAWKAGGKDFAKANFDRLHNLSTRIYGVQLIGVGLVLILAGLAV
ncbi:MAG: DUF4149 domain-containing protein [Myxococcota bacterium]